MANEQATQKSSAQKAAPSISKLLGRMLGAVGLVLWASAPLTYLLADMGPFVALKVLVGGAFVLFYLLTNRDFFARLQGGRSSSLWALSATGVGLMLTGVVLVNLYVARHGAEFDCTREGLYTLSPQTVGVLQRLDTEVELYGFFGSQEPSYGAVEEALNRYGRQSAKIRVQMVDPQAFPELVNQYAITERGPRLVVVAKGRDTRAKDLGEEELTNAIIRVVEQGAKTVYFLTGHGEGDTTDAKEPEGFATFAQAIVADGYRTELLNLQTQAPQADDNNLGEPPLPGGKAPGEDKNGAGDNSLTQDAAPVEVPDNVGALVIVAPMHKLLAPEVAAIERYLGRGGRVLALEEARSNSNLAELWRSWQVELREDLIVDTNPMGRLLGLGVASPIIQPTNNDHAIVRGINGVIMTTARSLSPLRTGPEATTTTVTPLMQTGDSAWGETQLGQGGTIARDEHDNLPPLYTAVAVSREVAKGGRAAQGAAPNADTDADGDAKEGRLVLFGDSDWLTNRLFRLQSNEDLALNALGWLTEQEGKITIRPKARAQNQLYLTGEQLGMLKFFSMDIVPVLLVALGLGVVMLRRQR